jgi:lipopolysaccharide/colanic/teichoic acid biosynthesis glycosyltransferase
MSLKYEPQSMRRASGKSNRSAPSRLVSTVDQGVSRYYVAKSTVDYALTILLLVLALPMMLVIGIAIAVLDGRPVFYRQVRLGKNGRRFKIWKFRTMNNDAERFTGAVWSTHADPRITFIGRWLRCSHMDELPQLFNILAGDMNLVGPRPERPEFVLELAKSLPNYMQRMRVKPGITGLAQLRLGYDSSVADVQAKVTQDLYYIQSVTFLSDLNLLAQTGPYIMFNVLRRFATAAQAIVARARSVHGNLHPSDRSYREDFGLDFATPEGHRVRWRMHGKSLGPRRKANDFLGATQHASTASDGRHDFSARFHQSSAGDSASESACA